MTTAVFSDPGKYEIKLSVNDGAKTETASYIINVSERDVYDDIDPESHEGTAPEISAALPKYADRGQKITAKIENLNNTEISWYSVIFDGRTAVDVDENGSFTITMTNSDRVVPVVVRAFDWSGRSDVKEYEINVSGIIPTVEVTASSESVNEGEEAYFTVNTTLDDKIKTIEYYLDGEKVTLDPDNRFRLNTENEGTYKFTANAVSTSGKTISSSAVITVKHTSKPTVDLIFDKDSYCVGMDVNVTVSAFDENGIKGMVLLYNGEEVALDENNSYCIRNITAGDHELAAVVWNEAIEKASVTYNITILPVTEYDIIPPELKVSVDKYAIFTGETLPVNISASDNSGNVDITVEVDGEAQPYNNSGVFKFTSDEYGIHEIMVYARDAAGNLCYDSV